MSFISSPASVVNPQGLHYTQPAQGAPIKLKLFEDRGRLGLDPHE
jgi:hypothetical protein